MKHFKTFTLLVFATAMLSVTSCSNSDDTAGLGTTASGSLSAKIDGASYSSLEISSSATLSNGGENLIIIASNSDGKSFSINIIGYNGTGTYPLGGGANIFNSASYTEVEVNRNNPSASTSEVWQAPYDDTVVGEIVVTEETDANLKGTFSFTCKNVNEDDSIKTITEGAFDLAKKII